MARRNFSLNSNQMMTCDIDDYVVINITSCQVQPDPEQMPLTDEIKEEEEPPPAEPEYLGKLEYSIEYDFQKQEVWFNLINDFLCSQYSFVLHNIA